MDFLLRIIHDLTAVHPPHPLFVHFPIALISAAFFFVLLAVWRRSDLLEKIAFANLSLAAVSTIFALAFGLRDNLVRYDGQAANHNAKLILATILFLLTATTALVRWRKPDLFHTQKTAYVLTYLVSFLIVTVLGFLGGVIIYGF
jgi:uncharacterized membrane protein